MKALDMTPEAAWQQLTESDAFKCGGDINALKVDDSYRVECATGDVFEGKVLTARAQELTGTANNHGNGFFRIHTGGCGGGTTVWLWLATYGQPKGRVEALQSSWDQLLERVFASSGAKPVTERSEEA
jgi:hypothetical protein